MATFTIFSTVDGGITSQGASTVAATSYTSARDGTGTLTVNTTATAHTVGQAGSTDFTTYWSDVYELFLSFNTSTVVGGITNVVLSMVALGLLMDNFPGTNEVRVRDWGTTLEASDFVAGANLAALTMVASWSRAGGYASGTRYNFTSEAAFVGSINQSGFSRYIVTSSVTRLGTAPGYTMNGEWQADSFRTSEQTPGTDEDPRLVITVADAVQGAAALTGVGDLSMTGLAGAAALTGVGDLSAMADGAPCQFPYIAYTYAGAYFCLENLGDFVDAQSSGVGTNVRDLCIVRC